MCEAEPVILSAIINLLTIIILLFLYLLSLKNCLWEMTKLMQVFARQKNSSILSETVKTYETPLSVQR